MTTITQRPPMTDAPLTNWAESIDLVVVGYVDTPAGHRVLAHAAARAVEQLSRVIVVQVATRAYPAGRSIGCFDPLDHSRLHPEQFSRARSRFGAALREPEFLSLVGDPAEMLVAVARDRHADLLVVGRGRPSWLKRLLRQDVAGTVARRCDCPVDIVDDETRGCEPQDHHAIG